MLHQPHLGAISSRQGPSMFLTLGFLFDISRMHCCKFNWKNVIHAYLVCLHFPCAIISCCCWIIHFSSLKLHQQMKSWMYYTITKICVLYLSSKFSILYFCWMPLSLYFIFNSYETFFFQVMSNFATAPHEKERLQYFASPEGRDDLYQYNQKERRTVLEVMSRSPLLGLGASFGD